MPLGLPVIATLTTVGEDSAQPATQTESLDRVGERDSSSALLGLVFDDMQITLPEDR